MNLMITIFVIGVITSLPPTEARRARNVEELTRCVRMAEPLVRNPEYVLPLTKPEIHNVCRMWGEFVDCVRRYTTQFLSPEQLGAFSEAIEPSMQSIHQLCAEDAPYRDAYLTYAPCMKTMYTSPLHCGAHYEYLADLVKGSAAAPTTLCCAHHKFRSCVLSETPKECGAVVPVPAQPSTQQENSVAATHFVTAMLDRALGFLLQQCKDYRPTSENCPGHDAFIVSDPSNQWTPVSAPGPSPYTPLNSFTWTPASDVLYTNVNGTKDSRDPFGYIQHNGFKPNTRQNGFSGGSNRIDAPTSEQFRGVSSTASGRGVVSALMMLSVPVLARFVLGDAL